MDEEETLADKRARAREKFEAEQVRLRPITKPTEIALPLPEEKTYSILDRKATRHGLLAGLFSPFTRAIEAASEPEDGLSQEERTSTGQSSGSQRG